MTSTVTPGSMAMLAIWDTTSLGAEEFEDALVEAHLEAIVCVDDFHRKETCEPLI